MYTHPPSSWQYHYWVDEWSLKQQMLYPGLSPIDYENLYQVYEQLLAEWQTPITKNEVANGIRKGAQNGS